LRKPAVPPKTVSVLVADFNNATSEPVFNGTLEPTFKVALEGATFISAYDRGEAHRIGSQLQPGVSRMDEKTAQLIAVRQGVNVVVAGSISSEGGSYRLSARAIDAFTGKTITAQELTGIRKDGVLLTAARLAARVRIALRDDTPESLQLAAAETFSAASVEAAHEYAVGEQAEWAGKKEEAITAYTRAVDLDPNLARAYANMAAISANLGRRDDAEKYHQMAMAKIDRMSDREKYKTRGIYYLLMRNDQKALEELNALLKQYPADGAGLQNLSLAYFYHRDWPRALEIGRRASQIYPKNVSRRNNVALYAMYAGDFETAEREGRGALELNPGFAKAYLAIAMSQLAQGQPERAAETYQKLQTISPAGTSLAATGLADLALYQGKTKEATAILERGLADDVSSKNSTAAAIKSAMLASVHLGRGARTPMLKAAEQATRLSKDDGVVVSVARVYAQAGLDAKAAALVSGLGARFEADPQAYAKLIQGEIQLSKGNLREAIKVFREAQSLADTWLGHFDLARAYVEASAFTEASSELDLCLKRRGEATALFLDDIPSYRYFPPVFYFLGRVQEGLKSPASSDSYKNFLSLKEKADHDPFVADARRRLALR
jgi:tetratricopeptide (TPR) repeat protein